MKQQRKMQRDFSYGGYAILADGSRKHAIIHVEGSEICEVGIPKKENAEGVYLYSKCIKYNLRHKRDVTRLRKKGVVGFRYETPTETSLEF